ncbi:MAG: hypothetical protein M3350_07660 [Actinomycetota bacterium]|nr:hypothetical protein [Actinomycetota bacterium]
MPYRHCPLCRLTVYSAAAVSTVDHCPRCDSELGREARRFFPPEAEARLARATNTHPADGQPAANRAG